MKNEKLIYSIGRISDKYITEAQPKTSKVVPLFRKPVFIAAAIVVFLLLCAFTVYVIVGDNWFQKPSHDPIETVRSAIENQIKKDYGLKVAVESIEIDEAETTRVLENYIKGELARRNGWTDEYLSEHFIVVKAVYYAEYDHTKTYRADGYITQYFYLMQDIENGKWTIIDNTGNMSEPDDVTEDGEVDLENDDVGLEKSDDNLENGVDGSKNGAVISIQEQITSYLSELFTKAYSPYYDGLHFEMSGYEETVVESECTATFHWTMYFLGKAWDVPSDLGVEQEVNFYLQATATIIDDGELDLETISILEGVNAVGSLEYSTPVEENFPNQLAD